MTGTNDPPRLKFQNYAQVSEVAYQNATYSLSEKMHNWLPLLFHQNLDARRYRYSFTPSRSNDNDRFQSINRLEQ